MTDYTVNAIAVETGMDRRTIAARFSKVSPIRSEGKSKFYSLSQVLSTLAADFVNPDTDDDYNEAKRRRELANAKLAELDLREREGQLVKVDDVRVAWAQIGVNVKQKIMAMPTKAAPLLLGAQSLPFVKDVLDTLIAESLDEIAASPPGIVADDGFLSSDEAATEMDGEPMGGPEPEAKPRKRGRVRTVED